MNDDQARRLLAGIDGPRALPDALDAQLAAALTGGGSELAGVDAPRQLPDDLRHRLEATLLTAAAGPVPHHVRRNVLSLTRRTPMVTRAVAAAAAVVLLAGIVMASGPRDDPQPSAERGPLARPRPSTTTTFPATGTGSSAAGIAAGEAGVPFAVPTAPTPASAGSGGATAAPADGSHPAVPAIEVLVATTGTDVAAGFEAYLRTLNEAGGIGGRPVVATGASEDPVATVNLDDAPFGGGARGVLFETAHVHEAALGDEVVSLASTSERQARLAVAGAFPDDAPGARAAIYTGATEPWATVVPDAVEEALRARDVTALRIPYRPGAGAGAFVPADAAFLSLAPEDVAAWIDAAPGPPRLGTWGVGSAWDDRVAPRATELALTVLAPYAPVGGDEEAALVRQLGTDRGLSTGAVHGWVTAKALAVALAHSGGGVLSSADLDALRGWDPGWAPPFETRAGTRSRTPDAVVLRSDGTRFVADGSFLRDPT